MISDKKIKIMYTQVLGLMSGAQRSMLEAISHLPESFEAVVLLGQKGPLCDEMNQRGVRYILLPQLDRSINPWKDFKALRAIKRIIQDEQVDIVHTQNAKDRVLLAALKFMGFKGKIISHVRGYPFHQDTPWLKTKIYRFIETWSAKRLDALVYVSSEGRENAIESKLVKQDKGHTIFNSFTIENEEVIQNSAKELRQSHNVEFVIGFAGRLWAQKAPLDIVKTAVDLEKLWPDGRWEIWVAGDGPLESEMKQAIASFQLEHRFRMWGWQEEIPIHLAAYDVLFHPTLWEGLPRTVMEAQWLGVPAVVSDIEGNREAVEHGQTGKVVAVKDISGYAQSLYDYGMMSKEKLTKESELSSKRAKAMFDYQDNADKLHQLYRMVLQG